MSKYKRASMFFEVSLLSLAVVLTFLFSSYVKVAVDKVRGVNASDSYYVSPLGLDTNPGTFSQPWGTIQKALDTIVAGDTVTIRGGLYDVPPGSYVFKNSGTKEKPITLTNYANEQVVIRITTATRNDRHAFRCIINPKNPPSWSTPKADNIKIIGSDVVETTLSNGVKSKKGVVILGMEGEQSAGIWAGDCDNWEVAGVDFIEVSSGIFATKHNWQTMEEHSTDSWFVHNNRVYNFYRESGMQFDGNFNIIEGNELYKVSNRLDTPHGCQMINLVGNNNMVRNNIMSRAGSSAECAGLLFEWDMSDANLVENNIISDVRNGISFAGGDGNIVRNNRITATVGSGSYGVQARSYDSSKTNWPCSDYPGSGATVEGMIPPNNPAHPDYKYYYPHDCHSKNNQIVGNILSGFARNFIMYDLQEPSNIYSESEVTITSIPTSTPTVTPRPTNTSTPTPRPTNTPTPSPSPTPTPTNKPTPTLTPTPRPTSTPTVVPTPVATEIIIYAAGTQASGIYPSLELLINDRVAVRWNNIRGNPTLRIFQKYVYNTGSQVAVGQIKLRYANDAKVGRDDRNLRIDRLIINGKTYQAEAQSTYSTGTWTRSGGCSAGYKVSEWLHCAGYFSFR